MANVGKDFFVSGTLSLFCTNKLWGYDYNKTQEYKKDLNRLLTLNTRTRDAKSVVKETQWNYDKIKLDGKRLIRSFITIEIQDGLPQRALILYPNFGRDQDPDNHTASALIITDCLVHYQTIIFDFLMKTFDCVLRPFILPEKFLYSSLNHYLSEESSANTLHGYSQLVIRPVKSVNKAEPLLSKITIDLRDTDIIHMNATRTQGQTITDMVYSYLQRHTTLDFSHLELIRVNCQGFSLTSNAKVKFLSKGIEEGQIWDLIGKMFDYAQHHFHTLRSQKAS